MDIVSLLLSSGTDTLFLLRPSLPHFLRLEMLCRGQDPFEALWITFCATVAGLVCSMLSLLHVHGAVALLLAKMT